MGFVYGIRGGGAFRSFQSTVQTMDNGAGKPRQRCVWMAEGAVLDAETRVSSGPSRQLRHEY